MLSAMNAASLIPCLVMSAIASVTRPAKARPTSCAAAGSAGAGHASGLDMYGGGYFRPGRIQQRGKLHRGPRDTGSELSSSLADPSSGTWPLRRGAGGEGVREWESTRPQH